MMRKLFTLFAAAVFALNVTAQETTTEGLITLDLTKATTPLKFDADNGAWTATYDEDEESIESQVFSFVHSALDGYNTWWGFTASNSADNSRKEDTLKYQFSNMAAGGIVLNDDGTVKTDEKGAPVVSAEVPYLVAYYGAFMARRPTDMVFNDGKTYRPQGVYINLISYPYYSIEYGDAFAGAFGNGDYFKLTICGVAPDNSERTVEVTLANYTNGNLTINRGWSYVDLTPLGEVNEIYFKLTTTDKDSYGFDNTPGYFALDKLSVLPGEDSGVEAAMAVGDATVSYNREAKTVDISGADFAVVCNVAGQTVMSAEGPSFSIAHLPAGVYVIKAGDANLKIAK